jgi:1,3-propanediol dehydrogenase
MLLSDPKLMARIAVVDPVFTLTVPPEVTAATGVDALTHAIEALYLCKGIFDERYLCVVRG